MFFYGLNPTNTLSCHLILPFNPCLFSVVVNHMSESSISTLHLVVYFLIYLTSLKQMRMSEYYPVCHGAVRSNHIINLFLLSFLPHLLLLVHIPVPTFCSCPGLCRCTVTQYSDSSLSMSSLPSCYPGTQSGCRWPTCIHSVYQRITLVMMEWDGTLA